MNEKIPFVRNGEELRYKNARGYVCENLKFGELRVAKYSKCIEDGFIGDALSETTIRYDCGLCVSQDPIHGTSSWYVDQCVGKIGAMKYARMLLGV